jgi:hypothetical protein
VPVATSNAAAGILWADMGIGRPDLASGRYLVMPSFGALGTATLSANTMGATPVYVKKRTTFSHISFAPTSSSSISYRLGVFANSGSDPGALIAGSGVEVTGVTVAAATTTDVAFSSPLTLDPGWYWLVVLANGSSTVSAANSASTVMWLGAGNLTQLGTRITGTQTYASGLPSTFGAPTKTEGSGAFYLGLKVQ